MASRTYTASTRVRVTYVEEEHIYKTLEELAFESGLPVSAIIRQATFEYMKSRRDGDSNLITRDREKAPPKKVSKPKAKAKATKKKG